MKSKLWIILILCSALFSCEKKKLPLTELTQDSFYDSVQVLNSDKVVLFYADWCDICTDVKPYIEECNFLYNDQYNFYKVDAEKYKNLASRHEVNKLPFVLIYKGNKTIKSLKGSAVKDSLKLVISVKY